MNEKGRAEIHKTTISPGFSRRGCRSFSPLLPPILRRLQLGRLGRSRLMLPAPCRHPRCRPSYYPLLGGIRSRPLGVPCPKPVSRGRNYLGSVGPRLVSSPECRGSSGAPGSGTPLDRPQNLHRQLAPEPGQGRWVTPTRRASSRIRAASNAQKFVMVKSWAWNRSS